MDRRTRLLHEGPYRLSSRTGSLQSLNERIPHKVLGGPVHHNYDPPCHISETRGFRSTHRRNSSDSSALIEDSKQKRLDISLEDSRNTDPKPPSSGTASDSARPNMGNEQSCSSGRRFSEVHLRRSTRMSGRKISMPDTRNSASVARLDLDKFRDSDKIGLITDKHEYEYREKPEEKFFGRTKDNRLFQSEEEQVARNQNRTDHDVRSSDKISDSSKNFNGYSRKVDEKVDEKKQGNYLPFSAPVKHIQVKQESVEELDKQTEQLLSVPAGTVMAEKTDTYKVIKLRKSSVDCLRGPSDSQTRPKLTRKFSEASQLLKFKEEQVNKSKQFTAMLKQFKQRETSKDDKKDVRCKVDVEHGRTATRRPSAYEETKSKSPRLFQMRRSSYIDSWLQSQQSRITNLVSAVKGGLPEENHASSDELSSHCRPVSMPPGAPAFQAWGRGALEHKIIEERDEDEDTSFPNFLLSRRAESMGNLSMRSCIKDRLVETEIELETVQNSELSNYYNNEESNEKVTHNKVDLPNDRNFEEYKKEFNSENEKINSLEKTSYPPNSVSDLSGDIISSVMFSSREQRPPLSPQHKVRKDIIFSQRSIMAHAHTAKRYPIAVVKPIQRDIETEKCLQKNELNSYKNVSDSTFNDHKTFNSSDSKKGTVIQTNSIARSESSVEESSGKEIESGSYRNQTGLKRTVVQVNSGGPIERSSELCNSSDHKSTGNQNRKAKVTRVDSRGSIAVTDLDKIMSAVPTSGYESVVKYADKTNENKNQESLANSCPMIIVRSQVISRPVENRNSCTFTESKYSVVSENKNSCLIEDNESSREVLGLTESDSNEVKTNTEKQTSMDLIRHSDNKQKANIKKITVRRIRSYEGNSEYPINDSSVLTKNITSIKNESLIENPYERKTLNIKSSVQQTEDELWLKESTLENNSVSENSDKLTTLGNQNANSSAHQIKDKLGVNDSRLEMGNEIVLQPHDCDFNKTLENLDNLVSQSTENICRDGKDLGINLFAKAYGVDCLESDKTDITLCVDGIKGISHTVCNTIDEDSRYKGENASSDVKPAESDRNVITDNQVGHSSEGYVGPSNEGHVGSNIDDTGVCMDRDQNFVDSVITSNADNTSKQMSDSAKTVYFKDCLEGHSMDDQNSTENGQQTTEDGTNLLPTANTGKSHPPHTGKSHPPHTASVLRETNGLSAVHKGHVLNKTGTIERINNKLSRVMDDLRDLREQDITLARQLLTLGKSIKHFKKQQKDMEDFYAMYLSDDALSDDEECSTSNDNQVFKSFADEDV